MMSKKKIIILILLFVAVAGFTLAPASAASKTVGIKDSSMGTVKSIGKGDLIVVGYMSKYNGQSGKSRYLEIGLMDKYERSLDYKITKVTVTYKSKSKTFTRTYKVNNRYSYIGKVVPKAWTPKKVKIYYYAKNTSKKSYPSGSGGSGAGSGG